MPDDNPIRDAVEGTSGRLTSRQRVLLALNHKEPDRVPIDFGGRHTGLHVTTHRALKELLGYAGGEDVVRNWMMMMAETDPRLIDRFASDVVWVLPQPPDTWRFEIDATTNTWRDEWGIVYYMPPGGYYYDIQRPPLAEADADGIAAYQLPDPSDPGRVRSLADKARELRTETDRAIMICAPTGGIWEHNQFLMGVERAFEELALSPAMMDRFAGRIAAWQCAYWAHVLSAVGHLVDVVQIGDDLGGQTGPLFSPALFRRIYKPKLNELVATIKRHTKAKVFLHSDGSVYEYIPDFIDCGVDILNPVQVTAAHMGDTAGLKREFGKDLSFWGAGCDNVILAMGSEADVANEARRRIDDLAPGGGFVFGSIHNMQANVPPQNIVALYDTARTHPIYARST